MNEPLEKTGYCWNCGRSCVDYFCSPKCKKACERKEQRFLTKRHGKRENYGIKGI